MELLLIIVAAVLYRIPRGGPDGVVWERWIGFAPGSLVASMAWFLTLGLSAWVWGAPVVAAVIVSLYMWAAEAPAWSQYFDEHGVDVPGFNKRGALLLNPVMGFIYAFWYRRRFDAPRIGVIMDGWTAWAELTSGAVTATAVYILAKVVF